MGGYEIMFGELNELGPVRIDAVLAALILNLLEKKEGALEILSDWLEEHGEARLNSALPIEVLAFHAIGPPQYKKHAIWFSAGDLRSAWEHAWNQTVNQWDRISGLGQNGGVCVRYVSQSGGLPALADYVRRCGRLEA